MSRGIKAARRGVTRLLASVAAATLLCGAALAPHAALAEDAEEQASAEQPQAEEVVETLAEDAWEATVQGGRNETTATLTVPDAAGILARGEADTVSVRATMSYGGELTRNVTREVSLAELASGPATLDLGDFGKFEVTVSFLLDGQAVHECEPVTVGVTADSYTIAPVSATLPTTFFSLNLWGEESIRADGPVIIMMERPNAYDWDSLPQQSGDLYGVYALPYIPRDEISYQPGDFEAASDLFRTRVDAVAAYVHDLVELDPTSTFDLYCVDFYAGIVQRVIYANKIPEGNYSITLMSDGSWTYKAFDEYYAGADTAATHAQLVSEWNETKAYAYENGRVREDFLDWPTANRCLWALVDTEPDAEFWVARKDLIVTPDDGNALGQSVQASEKVVQVNIASLLTQNIQGSDEATAEFKALYNFNDSYFSEAEANGREVMLLLGTRVTNEDGFSDYARFVMSYYGDAYQYYYKGHPGTPTELYPSKQGELESLGLTDVDSSVAAELILFFNPEIYLSGYGSSTYASVPAGMAKGMFGMTKAEGLASPEYANMDYWSSRVGDATPEALRALCPEGHACYLVEFSDAVSAEKGYDVAIWDATSSVITYYSEQGGAYVETGTQQGIGEGVAVEEGEYVIASALDTSKVLDVAAGSLESGANVQLYSYNGTSAQRWRVGYDESGAAVITNVGSGKALDVYAGIPSNGANVWQYDDNGSLAQRWRLDSQTGGILITSALSETAALDVAAGQAADGANVQVYEANGTDAQKWVFLPAEPSVSPEGQADLADGCYVLTTAVDLEKALDVRDWSLAGGGALQVWEATGWENQTFRLARLADGFYRIESAWSGMALAVQGGSLVPGTPVVQQPVAEGDLAQEWAIREQPGGSYVLENAGTGLVLDLFAGLADNGGSVQGYLANGSQAQRWVISQTIDPATTIDEWARENADALEDGTYVVSSSAGAGLALDVLAALPDDCANVQVYEANGTAAQRWVVSHDKTGYVTLVNEGSGKALDVAGASKAPGTNVWQYQPNDSTAQKWVAVPQEGDGVVLVSALSPTICLEVEGDAPVSGSNVRVGARSGSANQVFEFSKVDA